MFQNVKLEEGVRFDSIPNLPLVMIKDFIPSRSDIELKSAFEHKRSSPQPRAGGSMQRGQTSTDILGRSSSSQKARGTEPLSVCFS